ncbi:DASH complex subunit ask1 [Vanrija pseudolonga]|uniref:DASH complex subunit ASK1 n=1 Tax=Vanrija pseudolonga TaxID=143232 RepID=A0AAF1BSG3_9TREE|nr:DASH complex subunit ask1 [Vanrija pseudolonga]
MSGSNPGGGAPTHPALLQPPFFAVDGISPSTPITSQMEQIDQLNTLLLQEIDANFARFHQVVTARILPEIKRFSLESRTTREAADFHRGFYEAAAQVQTHPHGEDPSQSTSQSEIYASSPQPTEYDDHTFTLRRGAEDSTVHLDDRTHAEGSFMFEPGPGASSTPLPSRTADPDASWEESMGSPFERVDRQLGGLRLEDTSSDLPTPSLPSGYRLPNLGSDSSTFNASTGTVDRADVPSLQYKPQPPGGGSTPRAAATGRRTPTRSGTSFLSAKGHPTPRLIDLSNTPLSAKISRTNPSGPLRFDDDDDDDFGMSPPVTMNFGRLPSLPPRAQAIFSAGTPAKASAFSTGPAAAPSSTILDPEPPAEPPAAVVEQAHEIGDLLDEITRGYDDYEPSPRMPTPAGLGRYSILPSDFGPGRRLFEESPVAPPEAARSSRPRQSVANTSYGSDIQTTNDGPGQFIDDDESFDDNDDTFSSAGGETVHQPVAQQAYLDNSYFSDADGDASLYAAQLYAAQRVEVTDTHVGGGDGNDASLVFGRPGGGAAGQAFALLQQDDMVTYHGGRLEDAQIPGSPTRRRS